MTRTKVFVGNLSFKTKREDLAAEFQAAGRVVEANIITRGTRSLGYGFVEMESEEDAKKAIEMMNKKSVDSREINVELAKPRDETKIGERRPPPQRRPRRPNANRGPGGNGNNQEQSPTSSGNKDHSSDSPVQRKPRPPRENKPNNNNGDNSSEAPKEGSKEGGAAGDRAPGARRFRTGGERGGAGGERGGSGSGERGGRRFRSRGGARFGGARKDLPPRKESETSLFIANLPFSIDNAGLVDLYKTYNVKNAHVVANRNGKSKGFGFVELATQADQKAALDATNKTSVQGRELIVKIALTPVEPPKESQGEVQPAKEETKN